MTHMLVVCVCFIPVSLIDQLSVVDVQKMVLLLQTTLGRLYIQLITKVDGVRTIVDFDDLKHVVEICTYQGGL